MLISLLSNACVKGPSNKLSEAQRAKLVNRMLPIACASLKIPVEKLVFVQGYLQNSDRSWKHIYHYDDEQLRRRIVILIVVDWSGGTDYSIKIEELRR